MFDLGWMEMAIIAVITLMIVGPKDMPKVVKGVTEGIGKMKALSREFRYGLDDLAKEANIEKLKEDIDKVADAATREMNSIEETGSDFDYAGFDDDPVGEGYESYWSPTQAWSRVTPGEGAGNRAKPKRVARQVRPKHSTRRSGRDTPGRRKVRI